jgi:choline kinase
MTFRLNPLTGLLDLVNPVVTKSDMIKAILLNSDYTVENPIASIIFDEDSILFHDDEALDD